MSGMALDIHVKVPPGTKTLVDVLDYAATSLPDVTAIYCGDAHITYRQYRHGVANFAQELEACDIRGKRVVVLMGNSIEMSIAIYAIWAAGGTGVLLNPNYTERELIPLIQDASPTLIVCDAQSIDKFRPIAEKAGVDQFVELGPGGTTFSDWLSVEEAALPVPKPQPGDLASLQYTGGTTGLPKGARHTHEELLVTVRQMSWAWPAEAGVDIWCNIAPQFHIWGLCVTVIAPVFCRSSLVLMQQFEPGLVLESFEKHRVTIFAGGPSPIYHALMGHPNFEKTDFSNLRLSCGGGSPFALDTVRAWQAVTGTSICEGYGMSEGTPVSLNPADDRNKVGTCGIPCPQTELEIVDVETGETSLPNGESGEIRVRGPQMMKSYWNRPEENENSVRDGWVYTGDIGYLDDDGYIVIVDRKKDMAIVNGYNVFPREIDEVLFSHPKILEAAALGIADSKTGEVIHAYIVPKADVELSEAATLEFCQTQLTKYKMPARIFIVDALPRTPASKIDKIELRKWSENGDGKITLGKRIRTNTFDYN